MRKFEREELEGLTLEEAVHFLAPRGWHVMVHRYEEDDYPAEELQETWKIKIDHDGFHVTHATVSLDIQDGKVYDYSLYFPPEQDKV